MDTGNRNRSIKTNKRKNNDKERYSIASKVTWASTFINLFLTLLKLFAGIISNSSAFIADAIHSISDFISDFIILFANKLSQKPKDEEHPYGHSKIETISSFILGLILFGVGINIAYTNIIRIVNWFMDRDSVVLNIGIYSWIVIGMSILSKELIFHFTVRAGKKYDNDSLIANAWHHRSDSLSTLGVLIGMVIAKITGFAITDSFAAVFVSILIIKVSVEILSRSGNTLIDVSANKETIDKIRIISNSTKGVIETGEIKSRRIGNGILLSIDISVDGLISVMAGHKTAHNVKNNIMNKLDNIKDVIVHVDPYKKDTYLTGEEYQMKDETENEDKKIVNIINNLKKIEANLTQEVKIRDYIIRNTEHDEKLIDLDLEIDKNTEIAEAYKISRIFNEEIKKICKELKEIRVEFIPVGYK